ncbi:hypothetical protein DCS_07793 [Drechmeria coniospora]|uniref:USP domain-containing protein n=1 Tax=Drechmeria coniospora TaxID=98403 RepID=A0A151GFF9_DRECN|nr:hypothetical protein DCS_07793 [Drechmeria coniospora]KYK55829.1 hypothetical protein DCS_07793 [Drechmeria coniospora]
MAPASASPSPPAHQEEAASADAPSTRPNPFDDSELSSRKRRRTSVSGSPTTSLDTANTVHEVSSSATLDLGDQQEPAGAMVLSGKLESPLTPERTARDQGSPTEPPSSRVTINLRKRDDSVSPVPSPVHGIPNPAMHSPCRPAMAREAPVDDYESSSASAGSTSPSGSPPVELIAITEDDQAYDDGDAEMECSSAGLAADLLGDDLLLNDPMVQFPYVEPDEAICDTLQRLVHYLSSKDTVIDVNIIRDVIDWLNDYLRFAECSHTHTVLESRRTYANFWLSFPDALAAVASRRWELFKQPASKSTVLDLYSASAALTGRFVILDTIILRDFQSDSGSAPNLLAPAFLQQLHSSIMPLGFHPLAVHDGTQQELEACMVLKLQACPGGSVDCLSEYAAALVRLIPESPKLAETLSPLSQILMDIVRESMHAIRSETRTSIETRRRLEVGYKIWQAIAASLATTIDKHVASLNHDCTSTEIQALAETLKLFCHSGYEQAEELVNDHRKQYPAVAAKHTSEAISWQWKIDSLCKLIRSSQMHLRMTAVTTMCTHLVGMWKRLGEGGDEHSSQLLDHLAGYLLDTGLIDYILGAGCHPEIIFECANIVGFLVVTKTYKTEHTDKVWNGLTSSQDPRVVDALTRMMTTISSLFAYSDLLYLCKKFESLALENFSPSMRVLLDNVLSEMISRSQSSQSMLSFHPYRLCLRLLRESSAFAPGPQIADPEMQRLVMQKFKEMLAYGPDQEGRHELYSSCIVDISSRSTTTLGSLWCLSMAIRNATVGQMQVLIEQHNIAKLIVEELEHACSTAREVGSFPVLSGAINQPRRDFVTNLIQLQPEAISDELGVKLWNILVGPESSCLDDRRAGWVIMLGVLTKEGCQNPFLQTCFSKYLPNLPPSYFCGGMLEFIKIKLGALVNPQATDSGTDFALDDEAVIASSGVEQLWRIILDADDSMLVGQAVYSLAVGVYLESVVILEYPIHRTRQVHLALVARCLRQMKDAASNLKRSSDDAMSGDDDSMVMILSDAEVSALVRIFTRSLQLLRYFLENYQSKPRFAVADLRSFMTKSPEEVEGDSAGLKYQSFDGDDQTDIIPLKIGKQNTVSSLLASLKEETGFENYRVYYRGRQLLPSEQDICKSLEELDVQDGFILVKREENYAASPVRIKPGSLPLEIEILAHFPELWDYLSMEDKIAGEIYDFVVKLPADGYVMSLFDTTNTSYKDLFLPGQPFKSLYAVHALVEYIECARRGLADANTPYTSEDRDGSVAYDQALQKSLQLVVQALTDSTIFDGVPPQLKMRVASALMQTFVKLIQGICRSLTQYLHPANIITARSISKPTVAVNEIDVPAPERLVEFLSDAVACEGDSGLPLITSTCSAILFLSQMQQQFWVKISGDSIFRALIETLLLFDSRKIVRMAAVDLIASCAEREVQKLQIQDAKGTVPEGAGLEGIALYLWLVVSELPPEAAQHPTQCDELFGLLKKMLFLLSEKLPGRVDVNRLAGEASRLLLEHESTEDISQQDPLDAVASGLVSVLHSCMLICAELPSSGALPEQDRHQLGQVLQLLNHLVPYYADDNGRRLSNDRHYSFADKQTLDDPYLFELPFQFERSKALRSASGYVGLRNLSNTCYLNSLMTQLFMNPAFRCFILGVPTRDPTNSQHLLFHTQKIFAFMQQSYRRHVDPMAFACSIKTYEDTTIDIHNQMDVDEFYNLLFDRWEGQMPRSEDKRKLRSFYGGELVQQVKSKECEHVSERLEPFSAIQCDIKGKSTLEESLQAYVDGEIMEGDNKYKCSTCDRHVDAVKRACLKDVPDSVIFHLKRFDFNLRTLQRSKINDHFSFPPMIDMHPYTIEHLSLSDCGTDTTADMFELVGVLVHAGTAESGHYYSYIRERPLPATESGWVEFNDDVVTMWDPSLMASAAFGGPDNSRSLHETNGVIYDKSYSAYMLFYQRSSSLQAEREAMAAQQLPAPLCVNVPAPLREHIDGENTLILRRHCLFDPSHTAFVQACFDLARCPKKEGTGGSERCVDRGEVAEPQPCSHDLQNLAMEMALSHLDQIVGRSKDTPSFPAFSAMLKAAIVNCSECALSFYNYFNCRHASYRALLQRNPEHQVRVFAGEALVWATEKIAADLPHHYLQQSPGMADAGSSIDLDDMDKDDSIDAADEAPKHSVLEGVVMLFNHLWHFFQFHLRSWDEYFGAMLAFAKLGDRETGLLLSEDYLIKLMHIIAADASLDLPSNYARMLNNVLRRVNTRPPSYSAIITLADHLMAQLEPVLGAGVIVDHPSERLGQEAPFPWTSEEVHVVHHEPEDQPTSFLVEKLLLLDQAWDATNDIVGRLAATGDVMDLKILNTLRRNMQAEVSTQPIGPFLRAAGRYVECTSSTKHADALIVHACSQARGLQKTEGAAFLGFFELVLRSELPSSEVARVRHSRCLKLIPEWAPCLLVSPDAETRRRAERLIEEHVFRLSSVDKPMDEVGVTARTDWFDRLARTIGMKCLVYLREEYVNRRAKIKRDAAFSILQVVGKCSSCFESSEDKRDDDVEFAAIRSEIMEPLRRLMVDEADDDISGMTGSRYNRKFLGG